uniref:Uncharacterized protein n=1 Tax=Anopheles epiroticus TaxID=199890 RepID=A0A182P3N2_9DIPT
MVRNKKTQSKGANQPRRSITKAKANGFKTKKGSNKFAQTFQKVANTSPGKMLKQQIKRKSLQSPGINAHKRHKQQASEPMTTSNSTNVNNNRLPDKSKEVPNGTVNQQKSNGKDVNSMQRTATATIVIDDSDEENGPTSAGATETATGSTQPLFYIDRNPGIRDAEVPLYVVGFGEEEPATNTASFAIVDPENESVIVLDSTFEQTVSNSMKEMQINVDVQTIAFLSGIMWLHLG